MCLRVTHVALYVSPLRFKSISPQKANDIPTFQASSLAIIGYVTDV